MSQSSNSRDSVFPAGSAIEAQEHSGNASPMMQFVATKIRDAYVIEPTKMEDERGFFARVFCQREFRSHGLNPCIAQCSVSFNPRKGTLRGMHYQAAPHAETKLVRCTRGAIYDVLIDLRKESPTYLQWLAVDLSEKNYKIIYVPEGVAHGFQTLVEDTEVSYQISEYHHPECSRGVRWDDPVFNIRWPLPPSVISECDSTFPSVQGDVRPRIEGGVSILASANPSSTPSKRTE